ncbi:hypothetical protein I305_02249 [Cryptococcus gattii E566]|uniref:Uncharacterized protein n=2 Tax=Cryptococcus gattii TaxID=37769 RepID=E6RDM9_CRYGW|nr:Hypothetical Protein CGB_K2530W [Cryptococcus gattii WM276]ADV24910.1 Hypothetical Protein CGB_K2530W [Cryptococcus gattii WM276]KIR79180.1 hypothetical protein I306_03831 [Cryptococcus gattii EJB2]KIY35342.1 hypothetical protein I305_02249 [Cryptococcus gattii E566]KJE05806.1 hypothetical protein I311_00532 [Cryptococcus gattii NT-10]
MVGLGRRGIVTVCLMKIDNNSDDEDDDRWHKAKRTGSHRFRSLSFRLQWQADSPNVVTS